MLLRAICSHLVLLVLSASVCLNERKLQDWATWQRCHYELGYYLSSTVGILSRGTHKVSECARGILAWVRSQVRAWKTYYWNLVCQVWMNDGWPTDQALVFAKLKTLPRPISGLCTYLNSRRRMKGQIKSTHAQMDGTHLRRNHLGLIVLRNTYKIPHGRNLVKHRLRQQLTTTVSLQTLG